MHISLILIKFKYFYRCDGAKDVIFKAVFQKTQAYEREEWNRVRISSTSQWMGLKKVHSKYKTSHKTYWHTLLGFAFNEMLSLAIIELILNIYIKYSIKIKFINIIVFIDQFINFVIC